MATYCILDSATMICVNKFDSDITPPDAPTGYEYAPNGDGEIGWEWDDVGEVWVPPEEEEVAEDTPALPAEAVWRAITQLGDDFWMITTLYDESFTYTLDPNLVSAEIELQGGGAGAGGTAGGTSQTAASPGGGGGGYVKFYANYLDLENDANESLEISVTVGAGGAGGNSVTAGTNGGGTVFGTLATASGGTGSPAGVSGTTSVKGNGGAGGGATGDGLIIYGTKGDWSDRRSGTVAYSGHGGGSFLGTGGAGFPVGASGANGNNGTGYGGGGGGSTSNTVGRTGGSGSGGCVIIREYFNTYPYV